MEVRELEEMIAALATSEELIEEIGSLAEFYADSFKRFGEGA